VFWNRSGFRTSNFTIATTFHAHFLKQSPPTASGRSICPNRPLTRPGVVKSKFQNARRGKSSARHVVNAPCTFEGNRRSFSRGRSSRQISIGNRREAPCPNCGFGSGKAPILTQMGGCTFETCTTGICAPVGGPWLVVGGKLCPVQHGGFGRFWVRRKSLELGSGR